ncbi:MAG: tetratricopeptide repeat protein [Ignavibacteriaceae bacterium]|nr:tetratricopeptide repeat protein [Ignavibacteriaceae bacterium]
MTIKNIYIQTILIAFLMTSPIISQPQVDALKNEAKKQMLAGRYGEAIDLLNRYVSASPQKADGYNLRGVCYQKRGQYEMAVYDFRSAHKLDADDAEINKNLSETTDAWYKLLYNKIEGHKREIAIYPKKPVNFLEIGKCYKNLGDWPVAEEWYDKYLAMESASPDEIIRYTEILARNNHIQKGEPILRKYTQNFPTDQRLWSRYGYFELWLAKKKNAIDAFEKALAIKPYFKEAMNGLDIAKGNGYIYTVNDTSYRYGKTIRGGTKPREYVIDKYFRMLKKNPNDNELRFKLIDELIKHNRLEEAHEQLLIIQPDEKIAVTDRFKNKLEYLSGLQDSLYNSNIKTWSAEFEKNNNNRNAVLKLSDSYAHLYDYDNAIDVLEKYLATVKENEDLDLRFMLTKYCAWSYKWDKAYIQMSILLKYAPDKKEYKLFNARLIAWNVLNAKPEEIEGAKVTLRSILKDDPNNLDAILSMCFLYSGTGNIPEAEKYLNMAKAISPGSKEVEAVEDHINTRAEVEKERKILSMRGEAGRLHDEGKFDSAADKYDEIIAKIDNPEKNILLEYAAYNMDAKRYDVAIKTYDKVLKMGPDFDVASLKAISYMEAGDTLRALEELNALKIEKPYDYSANVYLGDIFEKMKRNDDAINLYESMLDANNKNLVSLDSSQVTVLQTRLGYLKSGNQFGTAFLGSLSLSPFAAFYSDNQNFDLSIFGGRIETGVVKYVSIGASYARYNITSLAQQRNLTTFMGHFIFNYDNFYASAGLGQTKSLSTSQNNVFQTVARYEKKNDFGAGLSYEKNDARVILYSPFLLNTNISAGLLRLNGDYFISPTFSLYVYYNYIKVSADSNSGHDFKIKTDKSINDILHIGYEYNYINYLRVSALYYSPRNFQSHSIWADWTAYKDQKISFNIGGKLGYIPSYDFILNELYGEAVYHPVQIFTVSGRISNTGSIRFGTGYNFWAGYLSCYLSIF